jgi:hypothetical protein
VLELFHEPGVDPFDEKAALRNRLRRCLDRLKPSAKCERMASGEIDGSSNTSAITTIHKKETLKDYGIFRSNCTDDAGELEFAGEWTFCKHSVPFPEKELRVFPVNATFELIKLRENLWDDYAVNVCALTMDGFEDSNGIHHNGVIDQILEWAMSVEALGTSDVIICHWSAPSIDAARSYYESELTLPAGATLALPEISSDSWLDSYDAVKLLEYGMPVSTLSAEQWTIKNEQSSVHKKEQRKGRHRLQNDDINMCADGAVVVEIQAPTEVPRQQNPFMQLSGSILSPFARAGSSLSSSVLSLFEQEVAAHGDVSGAAGASQKGHRRKKRVSIADRLSCAAPRDSDEPAASVAASGEKGILSAVFAACGGSRGQSANDGVSVSAPSSASLESSVVIRKQKNRDVKTPNQTKVLEEGVVEAENVPSDEMDV